jgi:hypothetical protein
MSSNLKTSIAWDPRYHKHLVSRASSSYLALFQCNLPFKPLNFTIFFFFYHFSGPGSWSLEYVCPGCQTNVHHLLLILLSHTRTETSICTAGDRKSWNVYSSKKKKNFLECILSLLAIAYISFKFALFFFHEFSLLFPFLSLVPFIITQEKSAL